MCSRHSKIRHSIWLLPWRWQHVKKKGIGLILYHILNNYRNAIYNTYAYTYRCLHIIYHILNNSRNAICNTEAYTYRSLYIRVACISAETSLRETRKQLWGSWSCLSFIPQYEKGFHEKKQIFSQVGSFCVFFFVLNGHICDIWKFLGPGTESKLQLWPTFQL